MRHRALAQARGRHGTRFTLARPQVSPSAPRADGVGGQGSPGAPSGRPAICKGPSAVATALIACVLPAGRAQSAGPEPGRRTPLRQRCEAESALTGCVWGRRALLRRRVRRCSRRGVCVSCDIGTGSARAHAPRDACGVRSAPRAAANSTEHGSRCRRWSLRWNEAAPAETGVQAWR